MAGPKKPGAKPPSASQGAPQAAAGENSAAGAPEAADGAGGASEGDDAVSDEANATSGAAEDETTADIDPVDVHLDGERTAQAIARHQPRGLIELLNLEIRRAEKANRHRDAGELQAFTQRLTEAAHGAKAAFLAAQGLEDCDELADRIYDFARSL